MGRNTKRRAGGTPGHDTAGRAVTGPSPDGTVPAVAPLSRTPEEALRESEERYRRLVELSPDGIVVHIAGRLVYANAAAARLIGAPEAQDLIGRSILDIVHPEYHQIVKERARQELEEGRSVPLIEEKFVRFDGSVIDVEVAGAPITWQGQPAGQVIVRDVSERKRAVERLYAAEAKYRALVEHVPAVFFVDLLDQDMTSIYVSPQIEQILGITSDQYTSRPGLWLEHLHPEDRDLAHSTYLAGRERGEAFSYEYRMVRPDGAVVWINETAVLLRDEQGRPTLVQGVMFDITERKRIERDLKQQNELNAHLYRAAQEEIREREAAQAQLRFQAQLLATVQNAVIATDPQGIITYWNDFAETLYGWSVEDTIGRSVLDVIRPAAMEPERFASLGNALGGKQWSGEFDILRKNGSAVTVFLVVSPLRDPGGANIGTIGVSIDVTERKRAEEALRSALEREKETSQQLRSLDEMKNTFLEAVSHELRTPLAAVLGLALTLERDDVALPAEESRDLVRRLASNARKLDLLLSDLLDLDRLARGIVEPRRHPTDIGSLVRRVTESSDVLGERPIRVDAELCVVAVDAPKVERIVENLLANAARHTPPGTTVWLRVESLDDGVLIAVEDEGPGVPTAYRERIFEPFIQGPERQEHAPGVGVGLSLVTKFADLHGGRAWVQDRPGGGASFRVFLPEAPTPPPNGSS